MMRNATAPTLGVIVLLAAASQACGMIVWTSLEDRVSGSDAVRAWWNDNKARVTLYVPKQAAGPEPPAPPANP